MNSLQMYQTIFERYISDIIDERHLDAFMEALNTPKLFGCKIDLNRGKAEKKLGPTNDKVIDTVNRSISVYNTTRALNKKLTQELLNAINEYIGMENSKIDPWSYINIKNIDAKVTNTKVNVYGKNTNVGCTNFTIYATPTSKFIKAAKGNKKDKFEKFVNVAIRLRVPQESDVLSKDFIENNFCGVVITSK